MSLAVEALEHLVINVKDVEAAAAWYERVLGMKREVKERAPGKMRTSMHFGRQKINLRPASATQREWFTGRVMLKIAEPTWIRCVVASAYAMNVSESDKCEYSSRK